MDVLKNGDKVKMVGEMPAASQRLGFYPPLGTIGTAVIEEGREVFVTDSNSVVVARPVGSVKKRDTPTNTEAEAYTWMIATQFIAKVDEGKRPRVGSYVKMIIKHADSGPGTCTPVYGTIGKVIKSPNDAPGNKTIWVQWPDGSTKDGDWWPELERELLSVPAPKNKKDRIKIKDDYSEELEVD